MHTSAAFQFLPLNSSPKREKENERQSKCGKILTTGEPCIILSGAHFIARATCQWASLVTQQLRIYLQCRRLSFYPWVRKILQRRAWQPTLLLLPRESHGQRSLAGCSPQGHTESDTTEATEQQQQLVSTFENFQNKKLEGLEGANKEGSIGCNQHWLPEWCGVCTSVYLLSCGAYTC